MIPTTLMGATLPLLVRQFVKDDRQLGPRVGALYMPNTLGAAVGAVVTGFWCTHRLGDDGSNYLAAAPTPAPSVLTM